LLCAPYHKHQLAVCQVSGRPVANSLGTWQRLGELAMRDVRRTSWSAVPGPRPARPMLPARSRGPGGAPRWGSGASPRCCVLPLPARARRRLRRASPVNQAPWCDEAGCLLPWASLEVGIWRLAVYFTPPPTRPLCRRLFAPCSPAHFLGLTPKSADILRGRYRRHLAQLSYRRSSSFCEVFARHGTPPLPLDASRGVANPTAPLRLHL